MKRDKLKKILDNRGNFVTYGITVHKGFDSKEGIYTLSANSETGVLENLIPNALGDSNGAIDNLVVLKDIGGYYVWDLEYQNGRANESMPLMPTMNYWLTLIEDAELSPDLVYLRKDENALNVAPLEEFNPPNSSVGLGKLAICSGTFRYKMQDKPIDASVP